MAGPRRHAREIALQILVQMDVNPEIDAARALRLYFDHLAVDADSDSDVDTVRDSLAQRSGGPAASTGGVLGGSSTGTFAKTFDRPLVDELVHGVAAHRAELDDIVQEQSRNWRIERMALVERNVIRLALYEMKWAPTVPTNVILNEAIELARRFGSSEGAAFVNGLLDRAATDLQLRR